MDDIKYYFVFNFGVYQGDNTGNIYIRHCAEQLPKITKDVINAVLVSNITNYHYGARKIFLDNMYACSELFAILFEEMNLIGGGTCRKNRICFPGDDERLAFTKGSQRGTYREIYIRRFCFVSTVW